MKHYHGTPIGGTRQDVARFLQGRHALVPFPRPDDAGIVADVCKSFIFDNGAFTVWKQGGQLDVDGYLRWLADPDNLLGSVGLPRECVEANVHSMREAIDMAMAMDKAGRG